jgi:hypothetical protein
VVRRTIGGAHWHAAEAVVRFELKGSVVGLELQDQGQKKCTCVRTL